MNKDLFNLSSYQFILPPELIAQYPSTPRDSSRLMILDRKKQEMSEIVFCDLVHFLHLGDSLVFNDTKVIPARILGKRPGGGETELLLLKQINPGIWETLARPGRKLPPGVEITFGSDFKCRVLENTPNGSKIVEFLYKGDFDNLLQKYGTMPLPHYISRDLEKEFDEKRYQTVYAKNQGAVAAPTAGLHFTENLLDSLKQKGIEQTHITLHVGLGTFRPVQVDDIRQHQMHEEQVIISEEAAQKLNNRPLQSRQICVGTTCCRALESATDEQGCIQSGRFSTNIFIYPGKQFKYVQSLLTNFHLPGSSLLMLVCAFGGYEFIMEAYKKAIKERFRFYSYGDAMLIL